MASASRTIDRCPGRTLRARAANAQIFHWQSTSAPAGRNSLVAREVRDLAFLFEDETFVAPYFKVVLVGDDTPLRDVASKETVDTRFVPIAEPPRFASGAPVARQSIPEAFRRACNGGRTTRLAPRGLSSDSVQAYSQCACR
jgi:hypothetical protein